MGKRNTSQKRLRRIVDIGLEDKDMVVSLDELPSMKELWPKKNNRFICNVN